MTPAGRRARRPGGPEDVGVARSTPPACASCGATPTGSATRRAFTIYDQADAERLTGYVIRDLGLDPKRFPPAGRARHDQRGQERPRAPPTRTPSGPASIFERKIADIYREYQARLREGRRHGLRRPARQHRRGCSSTAPTCSSTTSSASSTSSSTSTRTPTASRTSWSSCSPPEHRNVASSATATSACRRARWSPTPDGPAADRGDRRSATRCSGTGGGFEHGRRHGHRTSSAVDCDRAARTRPRRRPRRCAGTPHHLVPARHDARAGPSRRLPHAPGRPRLPDRA